MEQEVCPACPWGRDIEPVVYKLLKYIDLIDAGCPVERWELLDFQWVLLPAVREEREAIRREKAEKQRERE
jgi:hypothetical protein